ncbi:hypothetical protein GQ473_04865 [archaeon]|nr:hypothetical protein [archaeon]
MGGIYNIMVGNLKELFDSGINAVNNYREFSDLERQVSKVSANFGLPNKAEPSCTVEEYIKDIKSLIY